MGSFLMYFLHRSNLWSIFHTPHSCGACLKLLVSAEPAGYLRQLEEAGSAETFLDTLFGTDCYSSALQQVGNECRGLNQGAKSRLAFILTGCHLSELGQKHTSCRGGMSLKQCADALDDRGYTTYLKFLAEIDRYLFQRSLNRAKIPSSCRDVLLCSRIDEQTPQK